MVAELQTPGVRANDTEQGTAVEQETGALNVRLTGPQEVPEKVAVTVPVRPLDDNEVKLKLYVPTVCETGKVALKEPKATVSVPDDGPLATTTEPVRVKVFVAGLQAVGATVKDTEQGTACVQAAGAV